jgi:Uma2 family endonuclease
MGTSPKHEIYKQHWNRLIELICEELNKPFVCAGNMTFQREELDRGFEPDDCFWISNEPAMRGKLTWDPTVDPPPDLALEMEVSRSALNRMAIYAAFRIGEVWCFDGDELRVYRLQPNGTYQRVESSAVFPGINVNELVPFIKMLETQDVLTVMRAFREWLHEQIGKSS